MANRMGSRYLGAAVRGAVHYGSGGRVVVVSAVTPFHAGQLGPAEFDRVLHYLEKSKSANTRKAYKDDWDRWASWANAHGIQPMPVPVDALAVYLAESADDHAPATLQRWISSLSVASGDAGCQSPSSHPTVKRTMAGIRREHGSSQRRRSPLLLAHLAAAVAACPDDLTGLRDRAILAVGFMGALRRSEIAAINLADIDHRDDGMVLTVRSSKTDQAGEGRNLGFVHPQSDHDTTCAICNLVAWADELDSQGLDRGAVFRRVHRGTTIGERLSPVWVNAVVKQAMERVGIVGDFGGHSLRAGFATQAIRDGADITAIMATTRHGNAEMLRRYIRESDPLGPRNAARLAGW